MQNREVQSQKTKAWFGWFLDSWKFSFVGCSFGW